MSKDIARRRNESSWTDRKFTRLSRMAEKLIGGPGRLTCFSKSLRTPATICNANIFNSKAMKIWFGDLDMEKDRDALLKLSKRLGLLYILYETDGRFLEYMPTIGYVKSRAKAIVENGKVSYSRDFSEYVEVMNERSKRGKRRKL